MYATLYQLTNINKYDGANVMQEIGVAMHHYTEGKVNLETISWEWLTINFVGIPGAVRACTMHLIHEFKVHSLLLLFS